MVTCLMEFVKNNTKCQIYLLDNKNSLMDRTMAMAISNSIKNVSSCFPFDVTHPA